MQLTTLLNNISERGVRPLKTQQKISGLLASDAVTQDRLDIRSYIDTARKHGKNAMDVLHDLVTGKPWRPPAQACSPQPRHPSPHVNGRNGYARPSSTWQCDWQGPADAGPCAEDIHGAGAVR